MNTTQDVPSNNAMPCDRHSVVADSALSLFLKLDHEQQLTYLSDLRHRVNTPVPAPVRQEIAVETI